MFSFLADFAVVPRCWDRPGIFPASRLPPTIPGILFQPEPIFGQTFIFFTSDFVLLQTLCFISCIQPQTIPNQGISLQQGKQFLANLQYCQKLCSSMASVTVSFFAPSSSIGLWFIPWWSRIVNGFQRFWLVAFGRWLIWWEFWLYLRIPARWVVAGWCRIGASSFLSSAIRWLDRRKLGSNWDNWTQSDWSGDRSPSVSWHLITQPTTTLLLRGFIFSTLLFV